MSYVGQNLNVANSTPRASETQVGLTPYATTVETFFGVEAGKAVTPFGVMAALNLYGVTQADQRQATAWVNFNGTGTVAIRDAYNVSSITDNGTGDYTINFTTPMNNANYACAVSCERSSENTVTGAPMLSNTAAKTPNSVSIVYRSGSSGTDKEQMSLITFGGK